MPGTVSRIRKAVKRGTPLDFKGEIVAARDLREALLRAAHKHPRGLNIIGARVEGRLDLEYAVLPFRLQFQCCQFDGVDAEGLVSRSVEFVGCAVESLDLTLAKIDGSVCLGSGSVSKGPVRLLDCQISGQLALSDMTFEHRGEGSEAALWLDGATVGGSVFLRQSISSGQIRLCGSRIGGQVDMSGATLKWGEDRVALSMNRATVGESVFLGSGLSSTGRVNLSGCTIGGQLSMAGASLGHFGKQAALDVSSVSVGGSVKLDEDFTCRGPVRMVNCQVGHDLDMAGARLMWGGPEPALNLNKAVVGGSAYLRKRFQSAGPVRADGCRFGRLDMTLAILAWDGTCPALNLSGTRIDRNAVLSEIFSRGLLRMNGCRVEDSLVMRDANIDYSNPNDRPALTMDGATVGGGVFFANLRSNGTVRVVGCEIRGPFDMSGGYIKLNDGWLGLTIDSTTIRDGVCLDNLWTNARVSAIHCRIGKSLSLRNAKLYHVRDTEGAALQLDRAEVGSQIFLDGDFDSLGRVAMPYCRVGRQLVMRGASIDYRGADQNAGLDLSAADIGGDALFDGGFDVKGGIRLARCKIGGAFDLPSEPAVAMPSWDQAVVDELEYAMPRSTSWAADARLVWLSTVAYSSSAYRALAALYRDHGYPDEADQVLVAMRSDRRRASSESLRLRDRLKRLPAVAWDVIFRTLVAYGYRPWRLAAATVITVVILFLALDFTPARTYFVASVDGTQTTATGEIINTDHPQEDSSTCTPDASLPCWNAFDYALDTVVPITGLEQRSTWRPNTNTTGGAVLSYVITFFGLLGWLYAFMTGAVFAFWLRGRQV